MKISLMVKHPKQFVPGQGKAAPNFKDRQRIIQTLNNGGNNITTKILANH